MDIVIIVVEFDMVVVCDFCDVIDMIGDVGDGYVGFGMCGVLG